MPAPCTADEWLTGFMHHHGPTVPAADALSAAHRDGIPDSTLRRARVRLGLRSVRKGFGQGALWTTQ